MSWGNQSPAAKQVSAWPTAQQPAQQQPQNATQATSFIVEDKDLTPEQWIAKRDALLADWETAKKELEAAKEKEMQLRTTIVQFAFDPNKKKGTERVPLANGYELKAVKTLRYKFVSHKEGVSAIEALDEVLDKIEEAGPEGSYIAKNLVKWSADLSITEYNKLDDKYRKLIDTVIETAEGAPTLEIVEPKSKKK